MRNYRRRNEAGVFEGLVALGIIAVTVVLSVLITAAPFVLVLWAAKELFGLF